MVAMSSHHTVHISGKQCKQRNKQMVRPNYYDQFKCIADKCSFTCCQEWKIAVDDSTASKWKKTPPPANVATRRKNLEQFTQYKDGQRVVSMEKHICPFLDANKLCKLVCEYGDEILSETCRVFPREIHEFEGRVEATLMPCCPEVVDLLNSEENLKLVDESTIQVADTEEKLYQIRKEMISALNNQNECCSDTLKALFYILTEMYSKEEISVKEAFGSLPEIIKLIKNIKVDQEEHLIESNELFLDLVENYRKQGIYNRFLDSLVEKAENLTEGEYDSQFINYLTEYEPLLHKYLAEEVYSDILNSDSEMEDMLIRLEWIGMEYTLIRHMCYLHYLNSNQLSYENIRDYLVLASRIMGYEQDDIYEYMENCFEDMIWEWGYFALIVY